MLPSIEKIPCAVLLTGAAFEKKVDYVFKLIKKLLPAASEASWIDKSYHPDLFILPAESQDKKDNSAINIAQIREAAAHLYQSAHQGGNKIVVLLKADSMPLGAVNALLKILEEPPPKSFLFLISEYPHLLPATLRSRCQKINLRAERKTPELFISDLKTTLQAVKKGTLSCFQAGEKWQKQDFLEVLNGLFYCLLPDKNFKFEFMHNIFFFYDFLNTARAQILNKQPPNHLLALEHIFYQWKKLA